MSKTKGGEKMRIADMFEVREVGTGQLISVEDNSSDMLDVALMCREAGMDVVVYFPGEVIDEG